MSSAPGEITKSPAGATEGDAAALDKLVPFVYDELRRLAACYVRRERPYHTLQPTALVHEAYAKLVEQRNANWRNRAHFFAIAATVMRRILMDYARKGHAHKRGGGIQMVSLDEAFAIGEGRSEALLSLDEALERLEKLDGQQARIVELRFFGGLTGDETAEALGLSPRTVDREWKLSQAWLRRELGAGKKP